MPPPFVNKPLTNGVSFGPMNRSITIGTAGHADHGKTALVRTLTDIDTDRLQLEKQRGLSIESGVATLDLPSGTQVALLDVPGHTDFLKNTIRGLSSVNAAVLVVAADDGVMPQTREHMEILSFLKIEKGFVVLSKADLVDSETLELAELEISELVKGSFLEDRPVIPFSAIDQRGVENILEQLDTISQDTENKDVHNPFRLWIDRISSSTGFGTVASGTVLSGTLKQNDSLTLLPSGIETRARFIEVHHRKVAQVFTGQRIGINLHKVPLKAISRGMALATPKSLNTPYLLNVELKILETAKKGVKNRQRVKLYLGTSVTNTLVVIMEKEELTPGEKGLVQFRLMKPVAALPKDPFVICLLNKHTVIGGGAVLETSGEKYRHAKASTAIPYLQALKQNNPAIFLDYLFQRHWAHFVTARDIARDTGFPLRAIDIEIEERVKKRELLSFGEEGFLRRDHYKKLKKDLPSLIEKELTKHPLKLSLNSQEIKKLLHFSANDRLLQRMLAELSNEGRLEKNHNGFRSKNSAAKISVEQESLVGFCLDYARNSGLTPFSAYTIWELHHGKIPKNRIERLLSHLHGKQRLILLNDRRFLSPDAMEEIKARVGKTIIQKGGLSLADSKEILGYGRTVGVPVLEYLDSIGFTRREGNKRILINKEKRGV